MLDAGLELPLFAAFVLLEEERGIQALRDYYLPYIAMAREAGIGLILDTPTWRASRDWGDRLGRSPDALARANRDGVAVLQDLRRSDGGGAVIRISGCLGPRHDGHPETGGMSTAAAERYHAAQVATFAATAADLVTALTLTYADEAVGIVRAAVTAGIPAVVSFTLRPDGRLPSGQSLREAIEQVDAETDSAAEYVMVNCVHPSHLACALQPPGPWLDRIGGLRVNAARGDGEDDSPRQLGELCRALAPCIPNVTVLGGCCGTDQRHVAAICAAWS